MTSHVTILIKSFVILVATGFGTGVIAQSIVTDRPTQVVGSYTVPAKVFQIETGTYVSIADNINYWGIGSTLLRYGVAKNIELRMFSEIGRERHRVTDTRSLGISDLQVGAKFRFLTGPVEMSYMGHLVLPGGTEGFSDEKWGVINKLLLSHDVVEGIVFGYNAGVDYRNDSAILTYAWVAGFQLTSKLGFFVEFYGDAPEFENFSLLFDTGVVYLVNHRLQLDFSLGTGISDRSNLYSIGVSWRIQDPQE